MFQSFDQVSDPSVGAERLPRLRHWLAENRLDGFLVPRADEHQGEYVAKRSERLRWLTGFSGSAGVCLVLPDEATVFVDGRYQLQVRGEVDLALFSIENVVETPPAAWIRAHLGRGKRIGFDPWLHTIAEVKALQPAADKVGAVMVPVATNPIDLSGPTSRSRHCAQSTIHPIGFAGELARDKLARLAAAVAKEGATHAVLTDPSSLAWAFNIRGSDVAAHAVAARLSRSWPPRGRTSLFMDRRKLPARDARLSDPACRPQGTGRARNRARRAGQGQGPRSRLDPALAAERLRMIVEENGGSVVAMTDPARLPRATKNAGRDRRHPRRPSPRRRGRDQAARLARPPDPNARSPRSTSSPSSRRAGA